MRKIFTTLTAGALLSMSSFGQIGATAPNFTVTDIDGNTHTLYDYLNTGYVVILDCSATWCGPCWGFHEGGYLQDIHDTYGPDGTNQVRVLFYEADASTTLADLQGSTGGTQGDWLTGHTFPFINESPIQLSGSVFWPLGYPTVNVISPLDKKIKADLWDSGTSLSAMINVIDDYFAVFASVGEEIAPELTVYPNPANDQARIAFNSTTTGPATIEIYSLLGEEMISISTEVVSGANSVILNFSELAAGQYIARVSMDATVLNVKFNIAH